MLSIQRFTFNDFQENTYILYAENGDCCIIDPGCNTDAERNELTAFIQSKKLNPTYLLNTHCHVDHIFGNKYVSDTWALPLHLHQNEKMILTGAATWAQAYGITLDPYTGEMIFINENDTITIAGNTLHILFTPGHSPGSISFYNKNDGFIISGDVLFSGSIGRTDLPMGNYEDLEKSIKTKLYTLPNETKVYSGHGSGTSIGHEKKNNAFVRED